MKNTSIFGWQGCFQPGKMPASSQGLSLKRRMSAVLLFSLPSISLFSASSPDAMT
jgi:hypothetical protein